MSGRGGRGNRTATSRIDSSRVAKRSPDAKVIPTDANSYNIKNAISAYIDAHLSYDYKQSGNVLSNKNKKLSVSFDLESDELKELLSKEISRGANLEGLAPITINEQTFAGTRTSTTTDGQKYEVDAEETERRIDDYIETEFITDLFSEIDYEDLRNQVRHIKYYEVPDDEPDTRIPYFEMELSEGEAKEIRVDWAPFGLKGKELRPSDLETFLWQETPLATGTYYRENGMPRGWRSPEEHTASLYVYADVWEGEWNPETNNFYHDKIVFDPEHTVLRKLVPSNKTGACSEAVVVDVKASYPKGVEPEYLADNNGEEVVYSDNKMSYPLADDPSSWDPNNPVPAYRLGDDNTLFRIGGSFDK